MNGSDDALPADLFKSYPESLFQFSFVCCVILMVLGIPGNLITIIALATYKKYRNATAILIINLHISNLMFCSFVLPLIAVSYSEKRWAFGKTMCRVNALIKFSLIGTAHFTVVAITINRYIMVCHPFRYSSFLKKRILIISLVSTWILGFSFFLPSFFEIWGRFDLKPMEGICTMVPDKNKICPKTFIIGFAFAGPYLIMSLCYGRIWWVLRKRIQSRNKRKAANAQSTVIAGASGCYPVSTTYACQITTMSRSFSQDDKLRNTVSMSHDEQEKNIVKPLRCLLTRGGKKKGLHLPTRTDKKLATMILAILISFSLCHVPLMMTRALYGHYKSNSVANIFAHLLEYSSACISPIIYVFMSNEYRRAYKRLFDSLKTNILKCFR